MKDDPTSCVGVFQEECPFHLGSAVRQISEPGAENGCFSSDVQDVADYENHLRMSNQHDVLFELKRMLLAMSMIFLPACLANLAGYSLLNGLRMSCFWIIPGVIFVLAHCRSPQATHRLLVFLLPFGRFVSSGVIVFCLFWPITIPLLYRFNKRLNSPR